MKKFLLGCLALGIGLTAAAQLDGNGYYRVQNFKTGRYAYVTDDKGQINWTSTSADVRAIQMWSGFDKAASDPATIIYIQKHGTSGNQYDLIAQGTSVSKFLDYYPTIRLAPKNRNTYVCYATKSNVVKYLGDIDYSDNAQGFASVDATGEDREWYIEPLGTASDDYFGVVPSVTAGVKRYYPLFTGFPMSPSSQGVKFYTVDKVDGEYAVMKEISGTVPAGTPVIVECPGTRAIDNKINVGGTGVSVGTNQLGGVYFANTSNAHRNVTAYNSSTMRVLGTDASGNLAFIIPTDLQTVEKDDGTKVPILPANQSYLKVPAGTPASVRLVTAQEYEQLRYEAKGIALDRTSFSAKAGEKVKLTATLTPADAKTTLTWTSSNPAVASVDKDGNVSCLATGTTVITVKTDNGLSATCSVEVYTVATAITLSDTSLSLTPGATATLKATVTPADARDAKVTWTSDNPAVATVDSDGNVRAVAAGTTTVKASLSSGLQAVCSVEVYNVATAITLSSETRTLTEGDTFTLTATVTPADARDAEVTWTSENTAVATVSNEGLVTAVAPGKTNIVASLKSGLKAVCAVTVEKKYIDVASITLSATTLTLTEGEEGTLTAVVAPADATNPEVYWHSENENVATVENGVVKAVAPGQAEIVARAGAFSASCIVTVEKRYVEVSGITLNVNTLSLTEGQETTIYAVVSPSDATDKTVTWESEDEAIATVEEGVIKALAPGQTNIVARAGNFSATCAVTVNAAQIPVIYPTGITLSWTDADIEAGTSIVLEATVAPDDATDKSVSFMSANPEVASVDENGTVTGLSKGTAIITATTSNGIAASATVKVYVALTGIEINPSSFTAEEGSSCDLTVSAVPAEADLPEVTWSSSNEKVATVDEKGHLEILGEGTAVITAVAGDFTAECTVTGLSGIAEILAGGTTADIYDINGRLIRRNADADILRQLPNGLYIVNGRKIIK